MLPLLLLLLPPLLLLLLVLLSRSLLVLACPLRSPPAELLASSKALRFTNAIKSLLMDSKEATFLSEWATCERNLLTSD